MNSRYLTAAFVLLMIACCCTDASAQNTTSYSYDGAGRIIKVMYPDSSTIEYSYDSNGNILSVHSVGKSVANRAPVSTSATIMTNEDSKSGGIVPTVDDPDDGDTHVFAIVTQPAHGTASVEGNRLFYDPDENYNGSDSFEFSATDAGGLSVDGMATVTVRPVNDDPVAVDDNVTTTVDTKVSFDARTNDTDVDGDDLTVQSITQPTSGTAQIILDDHIEYAPNNGYTGSDSFTYTIDDGNGGSATGTVHITVNDAGAPVASDDNATTDEDTPVTVDVLANDTPAGELTVVDAGTAAHGTTAIVSGTMIEYTPDKDYNGSDTFTYTIENGMGQTDDATVTITVNPVNDAPAAFRRLMPADGDTESNPVAFSWTKAADVDGDPVSYTLTVDADGNMDNFTTSDTMLVVDFNTFGLSNGTYPVTWALNASDGSELTFPDNGDGNFTLVYTTGLEEPPSVADGMSLGPNYPNPFGGAASRMETVLPFSLERRSRILLTIHDATGREVARLLDADVEAGEHRVVFHAGLLTPGVYHYILTGNGNRLSRSMVVIR